MKHGQSRTDTFWPANSARWRLASSSVSARGRSSVGKRASAGTSSNSFSKRSMPIVRNMWARSSAVSWVKSGMSLKQLFAGLLGVLLGSEQIVHRGPILGTDFDHPASLIWIVVDALRLINQTAVDLDDFAGDRGVQIGRRLDRFDHAELLAGLDLVAHLGQLDVHDVAQLVLGKGRDAHHVVLTVGLDPL